MAGRESTLEQDIGPKKYREMIHKSSKDADNKNLPFTFTKNKSIKASNRFYACPECGADMIGTKHTVMFVCPGCKKLIKL